MNPKFSIAIPVYNRGEYLAQAIASCLRQTTGDFEVVVSDDCSSENLGAVVDRFQDARIRYSRSDERLRAAKNHQRAVSQSRGLYVLTMHSDDLLLPDCLETAGKALDECEVAAAAYFSMTYLVGSKIGGFHPVPRLRFADRATLRMHPWLEKFHGTNPTCCVFRRSAFEQVGGYRTSLRFSYDYDLYMRFLTLGGGALFIPRILCIYRKHEEQAAQSNAIDGFYDTLDLWRLEEYSHWPAWEIADLVLTQLIETVRKRKSLWEIVEQIRSRGIGWPILGGMPKAIHRRLRGLQNRRKGEEDSNYEPPSNLEHALHAANVLVGQS